MGVNEEGVWSGLSLNQVGPRSRINVCQKPDAYLYLWSQSHSKVMSDCIKPWTKVSIFGSLNRTARGRDHMPRLDLCILSRVESQLWDTLTSLKFLLKFYSSLRRLSENFSCPKHKSARGPNVLYLEFSACGRGHIVFHVSLTQWSYTYCCRCAALCLVRATQPKFLAVYPTKGIPYSIIRRLVATQFSCTCVLVQCLSGIYYMQWRHYHKM